MTTTITAISSQDGPASEFRIFLDGVQVGAVIPAVYSGAGTYMYTADVAAFTATPGRYDFALYRTSNGRLRSVGDFYWDGTDVYETAENELSTADLTAVEANIISEIDDNEALLTTIDGKVDLLETEASAATRASTNQTEHDATQAAIAALLVPATPADVTAAQVAIIAAITALNNLSAADVQAELVTYDAVVPADLTAALATLNDLDGPAVATAVLTGVVEGTITVEESLRLANAANAGKTSGVEFGSLAGIIRGVLDNKDRITATLDGAGNRTGIVLDLTP